MKKVLILEDEVSSRAMSRSRPERAEKRWKS